MSSLRNTFVSVLLLSSGLALAAGDPGALLGRLGAIKRSQHEISEKLQVNLARKRMNETRFAAVDAEAQSYQAKVAEDSAYCSGTYEEPEYSRRVAECANRQRALDTWSSRLQADYGKIERDENARVAEAESLYESHLDLEAQAAEILAQLHAFAQENDTCNGEMTPEALWACMCRIWDGC